MALDIRRARKICSEMLNLSEPEEFDFFRVIVSDKQKAREWMAAENAYSEMVDTLEALEGISWESKHQEISDLCSDAELERDHQRAKLNKLRRYYDLTEEEE